MQISLVIQRRENPERFEWQILDLSEPYSTRSIIASSDATLIGALEDIRNAIHAYLNAVIMNG